jgi:hypothetical protein
MPALSPVLPLCACMACAPPSTESGLTGTKLGCGEGGCGACTVMLSHYEGGKVVHRAVNACLCPLYAIEGMHVVTVEGEALLAPPPPYPLSATPPSPFHQQFSFPFLIPNPLPCRIQNHR